MPVPIAVGTARTAGVVRLARALSVDVAAGAVAGGALAAHLTGADLPWSWWPVLAASGWAAYTAAHLADARRSGARCRALRHRLHRDHAALLAAALVAVTTAAVVLAFATLPGAALAVGAALVVAVGVHLVLAQRDRGPVLPKEVGGATIYAAGLWAVPLVIAADAPAAIWWLAALHATAAFLNLGVNAWFELDQDRAEGARSLARSLGRRTLRRVLAGVALAGAGVGLVGAVLAGSPAVAAAFVVLAALQIVPIAILRGAHITGRNERYRVLDPRVARGFDRVAPIYDRLARLFPADALRTTAEALLPRIPPGSEVLVVGGGGGRILPALLATAPARVVWIDASSGMTARARLRADSDLRVVVTPFFLDLFESARLATVIARLARSLAPDGIWIHADFVRDRFRPLSSLLYALFRVCCGIEARRLADWHAAFADAGFVASERHAALGGWLYAMTLQRDVSASGD